MAWVQAQPQRTKGRLRFGLDWSCLKEGDVSLTFAFFPFPFYSLGDVNTDRSILNSEDGEIFNYEEHEYASKKRKKDHFRNDTNTQSFYREKWIYVHKESTKERHGYCTLGEAFNRLDFSSAIQDTRRFNYVVKMMIIPHLLRDKDQRATTATSPRTRQCWGTENEGVQLWPSQSSGGDETHLPLSLWARLMPGASVDRGHAPGLPKLEKAARLRSEGQNSTVSPTESRWEQGRWLLRLCGRIRFLAVEVACTPQLVLPVSNDWSFLLLSLHLPPSPSPALLLQGSEEMESSYR
ncbi:uncharacterized protein LOC112204054 isoform X2 [Pan troglodytes]|uniref:uncharacterized protein LOC112204054 isoform X2 n=1 Tax=Pan troglodytes TaxID=9598 RepID=UPI003013AA7C